MSEQKKVTVTFTHPKDSTTFAAEVNPATTGQQCIDGLVKSGFIEKPEGTHAYALQAVKSGKSIPLSSSVMKQGVEDGDTVAVTETSSGARI